jgi:hypothetical protein
MRNLTLSFLIWNLGVGEALADDTPSAPADQPIVTTEDPTSVDDPPTPIPPSVLRPADPYCPDQPDISGLQAEFDAYNNTTYASALEAKGLVPTTMTLKWSSLTYDPDAKERMPWKVTTVNGDRVLPGEVIHSDCGPWSAPTVHFGTKNNHSVFLKREILYRLEVTRPAVVTKSLTRCGCPDYSGVCGAYDPSSDQPLWVLPEGVKYGGVLEIEAPQKVLDIKLNVSPKCSGPPD